MTALLAGARTRKIQGTFLLTLTMFCMASCGSKRAVVAGELPVLSANELVDRLLANSNNKARYYSAKAEVRLDLPDGSRSFKSVVRSVQDSAVWVSVTPVLGIEMARMLLSPDTLKVLDRLQNTYFIGDTTTAKKRFGLSPDLALVQGALMGAAIGLRADEKYRVDRDSGLYILTSKEKRAVVRAAEDLLEGDSTMRRHSDGDAVIHRYWIEPDSFRVARISIVDLARDQQAVVQYEQWEEQDGTMFPHRISITLSDPSRHASGTLELSRIRTDGPFSISFNVPEKFAPMD